MAGLISKETIDEVQIKTNMVAVIGEYTKLESKGSEWWGCCPFHSEKTASFHIEPDKHFFYCFSCHKGADIIKFIMEMEKISYPNAIEYLAHKSDIQIKYSDGTSGAKENPERKRIQENIELYERTSSMFHYMLTETPQGKGALEYISNRGISIDTIKKFRLGYAPENRHWLKDFLTKKNYSKDFLSQSGLFSKNYPDVAFFSNRLIFPIFNTTGQAVAMGGRRLDNNPKSPKYLNSGDLIQFKKGELLYAFNFAKKAIKENKKVIFCEGYMDCIAYHQCGIEYAVAPLGTALTDQQILLIKPFVSEVLLSFDSDGAGQTATIRAIMMLRKQGITSRIIRLNGGKDPAEIMLSFGKDSLTNAVNNAIIDGDFLISKLGKEYPIDTPEGKANAAMAFFPFLEALQLDTQKESWLERLSQAFNLKLEAVKRDFQNRKQEKEHRIFRQPAIQSENQQKVIKLTAELRAVLAVIAHLENFNLMHSQLKLNDFEEEPARNLFAILEECFKENSLTIPGILSHCTDGQMSNLITSVISMGEFKERNDIAVRDSINLIKRKSLEKYRSKLLERIKNFNAITVDDQITLQKLLSEKIELDNRLKQ